ncbi:hypothetical protein [Seonamhaeicola sp.]|uniref:hypothetical protein n=1 Tax=Seonamhaeicola sp. TaxID=1912245 RepID=UPI002603AAF1|nr:hypothetical protein [Seonamhaeicola sp.]
MKNSTLLFRSLAIIILIAGVAHLVRLGRSYTTGESVSYTTSPIVDEHTNTDFTESDSNSKKILNYNENTDYITGTWLANYKSAEFEGAVLYHLKKEGRVFNAYAMEYQDVHGNSQKAEGHKVLTIKRFDGYKGKGVYKMEYKGKIHNMDCSIDMVDENTFKLSYDYYGYSDVETWKRQ